MDYFDKYCELFGIADPFQEQQERFHKKVTHCISPSGREYWEVDTKKTPEEMAWERDWEVRRDEYLRLEHIFRLWDLHDRMDWDKFQKEIEYSKNFTDDGERYLPCDCEERQCSMECAYFGTECPRVRGEELISPKEVMEIQELKWEEHDDYDY